MIQNYVNVFNVWILLTKILNKIIITNLKNKIINLSVNVIKAVKMVIVNVLKIIIGVL